jgi:hypothetical protein
MKIVQAMIVLVGLGYLVHWNGKQSRRNARSRPDGWWELVPPHEACRAGAVIYVLTFALSLYTGDVPDSTPALAVYALPAICFTVGLWRSQPTVSWNHEELEGLSGWRTAREVGFPPHLSLPPAAPL